MLPFTPPRPQLHAEKPAIIQMVMREDVLWNRPVFRAPPLKVKTPVVAPSDFASGPLASVTGSR